MGCGCGGTVGVAAATTGGRRHPLSLLCRIWRLLATEKTPYGDPCVTIPGHIAHKPDPCIYSQFLLMQLGQPVTWDNPDVRILRNGVEQYSYDLTADTDYDLEIDVHNSSRDKPAVGTTVSVRWIEFGAGAQMRHPISTLSADVPVWPGIATVSTTWRTPATPGHYCIEVELSHPNDGNPANNRGWNNTQVSAAHSRVTRDIRVFNQQLGECSEIEEAGGPVLRPHRVALGWGPLGATSALLLRDNLPGDWSSVVRFFAVLVAGYVALALVGLVSESSYAAIKRTRNRQQVVHRRDDRIDCHLVTITVDSYEFQDDVGKHFDPETRFRNREPAWDARVDPPSFAFLPGEAYRDVVLTVDAPDDPGPSAVFNVSVRQGGVPTGGVTLQIARRG
jgi:hypothetical protein